MTSVVLTCIGLMIFVATIGVLLNNRRYRNLKLTVNQKEKKDHQSISIILFSIIGNFVLFVSCIDTTDEVFYRKGEKQQIVSVNRETQTEGQFSLGSGYIEGQQYFISYEKLGNNQYQLIKFNTDRTIIHETDSIIPSYQPKKEYHDIDVKGLIFDYQYIDKCCYEQHYNLYVPKNTIMKNFKLD